MSKSALAYVIAVIVAAATFASGHIPAPALASLTASDWIGIATFIAAGVLLQAIAINFATEKAVPRLSLLFRYSRQPFSFLQL